MIRAGSMILLMMATLTAAVALRSGAGAQTPTKEAASERGQPDETMMQCPMMAGLKGIDLFGDSPVVLKAKAKDLKLTEQQLDRLKEIEQSARQQARELLTDEQRQQLEPSPDRPLSLMELSMSRMKHMQDGGKPSQMCPMCMKKMMKMKKAEGHRLPEEENQK